MAQWESGPDRLRQRQRGRLDTSVRRSSGDQRHHACDFTRAAPCTEADDAFTSTPGTVGRTAHMLRVQSTDPAGNSSDQRRVSIDNTPPGRPSRSPSTAARVAHHNSFNVAWNNPGQNGTAPIAAASYRLCPPSGSCEKAPPAGRNHGDQVDRGAGPATTRCGFGCATPPATPTRATPRPCTCGSTTSRPRRFMAPTPRTPRRSRSRRRRLLRRHRRQHRVQERARGRRGTRCRRPSTRAARRAPRRPGEPRRYLQLRATAIDAAGNQRATQTPATRHPATITLPVRTRDDPDRGARRGVRTPGESAPALGAAARPAHQTRLANGGARARGPAAHPRRGPGTTVGTVTTSKNGRFSFRRAGGTRTIRFHYPGEAANPHRRATSSSPYAPPSRSTSTTTS